MNRIPDKGRSNDLSNKGALAKPLKLKDSIRIRDGLRGHDVSPVGRPQFKVTHLTISGLSYLWVSNN